MSETGNLTRRVADVLKRRETLRIAAPAGAAVVVVGVLLGVFLTGGPEADGTSGQSVDIADRTAENVEQGTAPADEAALETADAGASAPDASTPEETAEAPPVPVDIPGGDIGAGPQEDEETAGTAPAAPEKPTGTADVETDEATPTPADPPSGDMDAVAREEDTAGQATATGGRANWCRRR